MFMTGQCVPLGLQGLTGISSAIFPLRVPSTGTESRGTDACVLSAQQTVPKAASRRRGKWLEGRRLRNEKRRGGRRDAQRGWEQEFEDGSL